MKKKMSSAEFLEMAEVRDFPERRHRIVPGVDSVQLNLDDVGVSIGPDAAGQYHHMDHEAYSQLSSALGVPNAVLKRMPPAQTIDLVNYRLTLPSVAPVTCSVKDNRIIQWAKSGKPAPTNTYILRQAAAMMGVGLDDVIVYHISDSIDSTTFQVVNPLETHQVNGEAVSLGVSVENSLAWTHGLRLSPYVHHWDTDSGAYSAPVQNYNQRRRDLDTNEAWIIQTMRKVQEGAEERLPRLERLKGVRMEDGEQRLMAINSLFIDFQTPMPVQVLLREMAIENPIDNMYQIYKAVAQLGCNLDVNRWFTDKTRYKIMIVAGEITTLTDRCPSCYRGFNRRVRQLKNH